MYTLWKEYQWCIIFIKYIDYKDLRDWSPSEELRREFFPLPSSFSLTKQKDIYYKNRADHKHDSSLSSSSLT